MNESHARIRKSLAALDLAALEALANKGLVRRAQKDFERAIPISIDDDDESLRLQVAEFLVQIPEGGAVKATCSCPAPGICQHILVAILWLNSQPALEANAPAEISIDDLLSIPEEHLQKWAGKAAFGIGLSIAANSQSEIFRAEKLSVSFPDRNLKCIYTGGGLDAWITSGPKGDPRAFVVAAVVALQVRHGADWSAQKPAELLAESDEAPRTRSEVLASAIQLLHEILGQGVAHTSTGAVQRLSTLSLSATGVNLPRLALNLRSLSDELALMVARDSRADSGRILGRIATMGGLCHALTLNSNSPRADLIGLHRTRYEDIGNLELLGVAAWPWRTASGYEGLTVLFYDPVAKKWNSWSEARPASQLAGFNPILRFEQPGPWAGCDAPSRLIGGRVRLTRAKRNSQGRLSSSSQISVLISGKAPLAEIPRTKSWSDLGTSTAPQLGLAEENPLKPIVIIEPAQWGARGFDAITQVFRWAVVDDRGGILNLQLRYDSLHKVAIESLESLELGSMKGTAVVGRVTRDRDNVFLYPFALHGTDSAVRNLFLPASATSQPASTQADFDESTDEAMEAGEETASLRSSLLSEIWDSLVAITEAGGVHIIEQQRARLALLTKSCAASGLELLATSLNNAIQAGCPPSRILPSSYIAHLHMRQS